MVKEKSHNLFCRSANDCEMYEDKKYDINPIYFDEKKQQYICLGLRDTLTKGKYDTVKDCPEIVLLNWQKNKDEEIQSLRELVEARS